MRSISFRTRASSYSSTFPLIPTSTVSGSTIFWRRVSLLASLSCNWYFLPRAGLLPAPGRRSPDWPWFSLGSPAPVLRSSRPVPQPAHYCCMIFVTCIVSFSLLKEHIHPSAFLRPKDRHFSKKLSPLIIVFWGLCKDAWEIKSPMTQKRLPPVSDSLSVMNIWELSKLSHPCVNPVISLLYR